MLSRPTLPAKLKAGSRLLRQISRENWGWARHRRWLWSLELEHPASQATLGTYLLGIERLEAQLQELDVSIAEIADSEPYREPVGWLRCFRGIDTLTARVILAELHDVRRFVCPRQLMASLGLVPREHSSGESIRRGGITKAGNARLRRVLIEAAWHYRHKPSVGVALSRRRQGASSWTREDRQRFLPTKHGHAALRRPADVTREYQSDSSSKRPAPSSVICGLEIQHNRPPPCLYTLDRNRGLTTVVPYQRSNEPRRKSTAESTDDCFVDRGWSDE